MSARRPFLPSPRLLCTDAALAFSSTLVLLISAKVGIPIIFGMFGCGNVPMMVAVAVAIVLMFCRPIDSMVPVSSGLKVQVINVYQVS